MGEWDGQIHDQLKRIADALEQLVEQGRIFKDSKAIASVLKAEDQQFNKETLEIEEMVYIDNLKDITILEESDSGLAYRIVKDGYTTWIAKSHIDDEILPLPLGVLLADIPLKEDRKWILKKKKDGTPNLEWKAMGGG